MAEAKNMQWKYCNTASKILKVQTQMAEPKHMQQMEDAAVQH